MYILGPDSPQNQSILHSKAFQRPLSLREILYSRRTTNGKIDKLLLLLELLSLNTGVSKT